VTGIVAGGMTKKCMPPRLLALSDLHVAFPENRKIVDGLHPENEDDWLLLAGDTGELPRISSGRSEHSASGRQWREFVDAIPQHWLDEVSRIAVSMSEEWRQFADRLGNKMEAAR
jgi:hypothetical protein